MAKCEICGLDDDEVLVIHYIDGNRENNDTENLMRVCSNCHIKIHKRNLNDKKNIFIDLKPLIFNNERLQDELYKLKERDKKVAEYLKNIGLI